MTDKITIPDILEGDLEFDSSVRPQNFGDFVGQDKIKSNLRVFIQAAQGRGEAIDHMLFCGPPGLGKTTLAHIIAAEMGVQIKATTGPVLERPADLAGILTNLQERDVLFIDEIHRINRMVEEYIYPAMEDYCIDIMIDKGPSARSVRLNLPKFTLIGATTRAGLLTAPMRARFGVVNRLDYYTHENLEQIITRSAKILKVEITDKGAREIAKRSRGTPRVANRLLRRVRDFAQVEADGRITDKIADSALLRLEVDALGLDDMDKRILETIIKKFNGGPVGLNTLAVAVSEEPDTLEEVYEPYLIQEGFLKRTPRGREATDVAYKHLGLSSGNKQTEMI
jgi:Holliday junction DNA helicase RuvB